MPRELFFLIASRWTTAKHTVLSDNNIVRPYSVWCLVNRRHKTKMDFDVSSLGHDHSTLKAGVFGITVALSVCVIIAGKHHSRSREHRGCRTSSPWCGRSYFWSGSINLVETVLSIYFFLEETFLQIQLPKGRAPKNRKRISLNTSCKLLSYHKRASNTQAKM